MGPRPRRAAGKRHAFAPAIAARVFSALGDETRLALIDRLSGGEAQSISQLAEGSPITRQAITKHLKVLEEAGLVQMSRSGRESLFALTPEPIGEARDYLDFVSSEWDQALLRLKAFVED